MTTDIADFANKHHNKLCFIAGASPSLRFVQPDFLNRFVTICVNSAILKFPQCNYFVTDDHGVCTWNYWTKTVRESSCINFLYKTKLQSYVEHLPENRVVFYEHRNWVKNASRNGHEIQNLKMHADPAMPIIGARSSLASALNIAFIMGCNPIVLLGCDGCYEQNKRYFWQFPNEPKAYELNNRVFASANSGLIDNKPVDHHCVEYDLYWQDFAYVNPDLLHGRIINASVNGIVNIFPKVELSEVLRQYGDRHV